MKRILVAMSGGVDSSVAAHLLKEQGHAVSGAYMKNWINQEQAEVFGRCPWQEDLDDARRVCACLGIDFRVVNFMSEYKTKVVNYLVRSYRAGLTPNPDIMCNREIKFGHFLNYALEEGFDGIATGHYVEKTENDGGRCAIYEGRDKDKDQSYFLAMLKREQVEHALFPLGPLEKHQVRKIARAKALPNTDKRESQGICFIGKVKLSEFLRHYIPDNPGPVTDGEGNLLGNHRGLHRYTVGQRHGIGVPSNQDGESYVVVDKDMASRRLVVGLDQPRLDRIYAPTVLVKHLSFIAARPSGVTCLHGRIRYRDPTVPLTFYPEDGDTASIRFEIPQRAPAAGQTLALYYGRQLIGGGIL